MNADKLVNEISTIINTLNEHGMESLSTDTLSRIAVKLASYKASLGEYVAAAKKLVWDAEAEYTNAKAEAFQKLRDDGVNSTDSKELKALQAHDFFVKWNKARYQSERIKLLHEDCHDLIDGIKSRLITLHEERSETRVH